MNPRDLLSYCEAHTEAMLHTLRQAVEIESPTNSKAGVDAMAEFWAKEFRRAGAHAKKHVHRSAGCALTAEFFGRVRGAKPILLLGHSDTVWDTGTLARMPYRQSGGRAYGPGILDMKSGVVVGIWALRALTAVGIQPRSRVRFFLNSDEEAGSQAFRSRLFAEARRARACLVLEPAAKGGALKTARKGVALFRISVRGRSAHAGIDPKSGVSAISELAQQILQIEHFARTISGLTVNVGVIEGGTRANVVPESASALVDARLDSAKYAARIEQKMKTLKPIHHGAHLEITGGVNRPPMERHHTEGLFERARVLAAQLDFKLLEAATGGGSDGSFAAALGIPTLDGLGGVGDGAHARNEHIVIRELPRRAGLLAALIASI